MGRKRDHDSAFQSDIITIFVGHDKKRFTAHKQYLMECDYFKACLERGWKKVNADEINMPEDRPEAVDVLLQFLYNDKILGHLQYTRGAQLCLDYCKLLVATYITADKYCVEKLQNKIVDVVAEWCQNGCFKAWPVTRLTVAELFNSNLRKLLVQNVAYSLVRLGFEVCCQTDQGLVSFVCDGGIDSVDLLRVTLALALMRDRENPADVKNVCDAYHVHQKTKKCEKALNL